jgi:hypothetical protein
MTRRKGLWVYASMASQYHLPSPYLQTFDCFAKVVVILECFQHYPHASSSSLVEVQIDVNCYMYTGISIHDLAIRGY